MFNFSAEVKSAMFLRALATLETRNVFETPRNVFESPAAPETSTPSDRLSTRNLVENVKRRRSVFARDTFRRIAEKTTSNILQCKYMPSNILQVYQAIFTKQHVADIVNMYYQVIFCKLCCLTFGASPAPGAPPPPAGEGHHRHGGGQPGPDQEG